MDAGNRGAGDLCLREVAQLVLLDLGGVRAFGHGKGVNGKKSHGHFVLCKPCGYVSDDGSLIQHAARLQGHEAHGLQSTTDGGADHLAGVDAIAFLHYALDLERAHEEPREPERVAHAREVDESPVGPGGAEVA